jgi:hypothetical protein
VFHKMGHHINNLIVSFPLLSYWFTITTILKLNSFDFSPNFGFFIVNVELTRSLLNGLLPAGFS